MHFVSVVDIVCVLIPTKAKQLTESPKAPQSFPHEHEASVTAYVPRGVSVALVWPLVRRKKSHSYTNVPVQENCTRWERNQGQRPQGSGLYTLCDFCSLVCVTPCQGLTFQILRTLSIAVP